MSGTSLTDFWGTLNVVSWSKTTIPLLQPHLIVLMVPNLSLAEALTVTIELILYSLELLSVEALMLGGSFTTVTVVVAEEDLSSWSFTVTVMVCSPTALKDMSASFTSFAGQALAEPEQAHSIWSSLDALPR